MLGDKTFLAVIPARGGSKGIPGKNLLMLHGKSLLERTFDQARGSEFIDRVILSTEDSDIQKAARDIALEVPFTRPMNLATDTASSIDVVRHGLLSLEGSYDFVVLLQITSPLRLSEDIDKCISLCLSSNAPACVSVVKSEMPPDMLFSLDDRGCLEPNNKFNPIKPRRQDQNTFFYPNGAVYVANTDWIMKAPHFISNETVAHVMPRQRSVDLDEPEDWEVIKILSDGLD